MRFPAVLSRAILGFGAVLWPATALAPLLLAGCAMPERQDPFAGVGLEEAGGFPTLSVALISSKNMKASAEYGRRGELLGLVHGATDKWIKQEAELFKKRFGRVVRADSFADAKAAGVDVVAVVDVYDETFRACKYDETVVFFDPAGAELDRVRGRTNVPFGPGRSVRQVLDDCVADVEGQLARGIAASRALRALEESKAAGQSAAAKLPEILHPGFTSAADESSFAVVVGVERYAKVPPADFAERDAAAVKEHLLALGLPERNIVRLAGPEASYSSLKKYVETWLPRNAKAGGRVFFYFSGHGAPDVATGAAYLLPWDGDPSFLKDTAYPTQRLFEQLAALPAGEIVVALDSCFSGAGGRSVLPKGARPLVVKLEGAGDAPVRLTIFAAAASEEITGSLDDKGHGAFTYYFLKGLEGEARDAAGRVSARGLYDYLRPRVQDAARRQNREQTPMLRGPDGVVLR